MILAKFTVEVINVQKQINKIIKAVKEVSNL